MPGRDIRAGGAYVEFSLRRKNLERSLREVGNRIKQFGSQIRQIGASLSAIGAAITAPFAGAIATYAKVGDSLEKMSRRTGIAVESLSELEFAAQQNGSSLGTLERGIRTSQRAIVDLGRGLSTQVFAFDQLGLTYQDLDRLSPEQQFTLIADRVGQIEDPTKRAAVAMQIFGRSGQELIPLLSQGAAGIEAFRQEARDAGIVISNETAKGAAAFLDSLNKIKLQVKAAAVAVGAALAPAITKLFQSFTTVGRSIIDFVKENRSLVVIVASTGAAILVLGTALIGLGTAVGLAGFALTSLVGLISALLSPLGLLVVGIGGAAAALLTFTDTGSKAIQFLRDQFGGLLDTATQAFAGIRNALEGGDLQLAAEILWTSLRLIFFEGAQDLIQKGIELKAGVLKAITELTIGAIGLGSELFSRLQNVWTNIAAGAKKAFANLSGDIAETFNLIRLQASKAGNAVRSALDPDFDASGANQDAERLFVDRQNRAQAQRKKAIDEITAEQKARLEQIKADGEARKTAIQEALDAELAAIDQGKKAEATRLRERIKNLRAEQAELLKQADAIAKNTAVADDPTDLGPSDGDRDFRAREIARVAGITSSFDIRSLSNTSRDDQEAKRLRNVQEKALKAIETISRKLPSSFTGFTIS
ncbi:MAG: phage tail tape measure protein [Planctomycetota bacterium]